MDEHKPSDRRAVLLPADAVTTVRVIEFYRFLRSESFRVSTVQLLHAIRALPLVNLEKPHQFKDALRATLTSNAEEYLRFDELFRLFFSKAAQLPPLVEEGESQARTEPEGSGSAPGNSQATPTDRLSLYKPDGSPTRKEGQADRLQGDSMLKAAIYSPLETLCQSDIASLDPHQIVVLRAAIRRLASKMPQMPSRRRQRTRKRSGSLDVRSTLRDSLRWDGEPLRLRHSARRPARPRLVLLADVSGSMQLYAEFLLEVLVAAREALPMVETFVFSTRLTRITPYVRSRRSSPTDTESIGRKLSTIVTHWGGGTDIGKSLREFNDRFATFLLSKKTATVIMSDGWDRGDPQILSKEIRRLRHGCAALIWLNPLMGDPRYEPICEGIRTALPFIDAMYPAYNVSSFLEFVRDHLAPF